MFRYPNKFARLGLPVRRWAADVKQALHFQRRAFTRLNGDCCSQLFTALRLMFNMFIKCSAEIAIGTGCAKDAEYRG